MIDIKIENIKLNQHNEKRKCLGFPIVTIITDDEKVREEYDLWRYRIGGAKYTSCLKIDN